MPARVALVHYTCPPVVGGVESLIELHARLFADHGYEAAVFAGRGRVFDPRVPVYVHGELDSRHPSVVAVDAELERGEVTPRFFALRDRLIAWWKETLASYDAAIVHNAFVLHFNLALTAALHEVAGTGGPRMIAWCHDPSWVSPRFRPKMYDAYPWTLLKTAHPDAFYVTISRLRQGELGSLLGLPAAAITNVERGIETEAWFRFRRATKRVLAALRLEADELVLLLPERLTPDKNIELAIRVVGAMVAAGARPRLLITGPPDPHDARTMAYRDALFRLRDELGVARQVDFLYRHRLSNASMADLYQVADALIFPSVREGFGVPMLEAGMARLPIFCSDLAPFREIAGEGRATYFALDAEPAAIARSIVDTLASDPTALMRRRVREAYGWQRIFRDRIAPLVDGASARAGWPHPSPRATALEA